jgi:hypothetical protein
MGKRNSKPCKWVFKKKGSPPNLEGSKTPMYKQMGYIILQEHDDVCYNYPKLDLVKFYSLENYEHLSCLKGGTTLFT